MILGSSKILVLYWYFLIIILYWIGIDLSLPDCLYIIAQIDQDFIAKHLLNYGCDQPSNTASVDVPADDSFWTSRPDDINSAEYRVWYSQYLYYCEYYKEQGGGASSNTAVPQSGQVETPDMLATANESKYITADCTN